MTNLDRARDFAESKFKKKERRLLEGQEAVAEYGAVGRAVNANTARLRALRLARDAAEDLAPARSTELPPPKKGSA